MGKKDKIKTVVEEEPEEVEEAPAKTKKEKKTKKEVVAEEETIEAEEEPKAKKAKKEKKAAKEALEVEEEEAVPVPEKKKKKKKAAEEEAVEEEEAVAAPEKKKKKKAAEEEAEEAVPAPVKEKKVEKKEEPKKDGEEEEWKDITSHCVDCDKDFEFTAGEQAFLFEKGFDVMAKRCKDCKWAKKNGGKDGGGKDGKGKGKGKEGGKGSQNENTVFVRGLPFATTQEALNKDFGECGEITRCGMPLNEEGTCKGIAFISFTTKEAMDKAIAFDNTDYGGRFINVRDAADESGKGKGKDGKGKDGKGKDGKGKGKKGKGKGKAPSESFSKSTGAILESTGEKKTFEESDDE